MTPSFGVLKSPYSCHPWPLKLKFCEQVSVFKKCFEKLSLYHCFENLATDLKKLCRRVSLADCHSIIFWIFICLFPDIHLFLINCYLFQFLNYMFLLVFELFLPVSASFLIVSTSFYSFTCLCVDQLVIYQSFLLVSAHLPVVSHFIVQIVLSMKSNFIKEIQDVHNISIWIKQKYTKYVYFFNWCQ